jgi:hypothetical protein
MTKKEIEAWFLKYGQYAKGTDYALLNAIEAIVSLKRTWTELTDEDIECLRDGNLYSVQGVIQGHKAFAKALEAKLKEKNT